MNQEDFEYILSWKPGNSSRMPACYTVMYKMKRCSLPPPLTRSHESQDSDHHVLGPGELAACPAFSETDAQRTPMKHVLSGIISNFKTVQECTNITRPFCNLTNEFADFCQGNAFIIVQQDTSNEINYSDILQFSPYTQRCFRPPQFNISVCQNCANVTVKLSPLLLKIYHKLNYRITVKTDGLKENRIDNTTKQDSFFTILEDLHPNKNYCIAVEVSTDFNRQCTFTIPKCIMLDSSNGKDMVKHYIRHKDIFSVQGKSFEQDLKRIIADFDNNSNSETELKVLPSDNHPYLCAREHKNITPNLANSVFEPEHEKICDVQLLESEVQQHSDDENSESDAESNFDTNCDIFQQITPFPEVDITQKIFTGCSATTNEVTRTLAEKNQNDIDKGSPITPLYPSEVNSGHVERTDCLNVNLKTVKLGISDTDLDFSTFDHEDILDLNESCIPDGFEPNHITEMPDSQSFDVQSPLCSWENVSVSSE
ncbi:hypothetical protein E2320_005129, partial [Naja naja]